MKYYAYLTMSMSNPQQFSLEFGDVTNFNVLLILLVLSVRCKAGAYVTAVSFNVN